jgi:hypothetical protein
MPCPRCNVSEREHKPKMPEGYAKIFGRDGWVNRMAELENMKSWTEHLGHSRLRSFTDKDGHLWLEQNAEKRSKWAKLA